jgi:hypothetical protein
LFSFSTAFEIFNHRNVVQPKVETLELDKAAEMLDLFNGIIQKHLPLPRSPSFVANVAVTNP